MSYFGYSELPKSFSKKENIEYFKKLKDGDSNAKDELIKHNLRLVFYITKRYENEYYKDDLDSIGIMGLIKSINTFDIEKGYEFTTYASKVINNEILMFFRKENKYIQVDSFEKTIGHDKNGNELSLNDILADENSDFTEQYDLTEEEMLIRRAVKKLPEKERNIIEMHFGFNGNKPHTQKEIAQILNFSQSYVSRLITKILPEVKSKFLKEKIIVKKFDIKEIHPNMTEVIFFSLINLFPEEDIKLYQKYRNLNITNRAILPSTIEEDDYQKSTIFHIKIIERNLYEMFDYYQTLIEKNINHENAILKTNKWVIKHSIRFKYKKKSLKDLLQYVAKLPPSLKQAVNLRFGQNLLEYHVFPLDKNNYEQYLSLAYKKIDKFIKDDILKQPNKKSLVAKYSEISIEKLKEYVSMLPEEYKEIIYIRNGKTLDNYYKFPKDKSYQPYYILYTKALQALDDLINGKEVIIIPKKTIINTYSKEELDYAIPKLKAHYREVIYLRHSKNLDTTLDWPSAPEDKHENYYIQKYYNCFKKIDDILKQREINKNNIYLVNKLRDYTYEEVISAISQLNKEEQDIIFLRHGKTLDEFNPYPVHNQFKNYKKVYDEAMYNLRNILKQTKYPEEYEKIQKIIEENKRKKDLEKEALENTKKRKTIIEKISHDNLLWAFQHLTENQKNIIILRHGPNLDKVLSWPEVPKGKKVNYYHANYFYICKKIKNLVEHREEIEASKFITKENEHPKKHLTIIDKYSHEELLEIIVLLTENQKKIIYLRHGENLDKVLPWPEAPNGKSRNYYYASYQNIERKIKKLKDKSNEPKKVNVKKTIIDKIEHDKLLKLVEQLSAIQKEIFYLRHGANLDQVLPWPKAPEGKSNSYYYVMYNQALKKINKLIDQKDKNINKIRKTKNTIIDKVSHEDLIWAIKYLTENQKNILILRHGTNLDQVNSWPEVPDGKSGNYYHSLYYLTTKKVEKLLKEKTEQSVYGIKVSNELLTLKQVVEKYGLLLKKYEKDNSSINIEELKDIYNDMLLLVNEPKTEEKKIVEKTPKKKKAKNKKIDKINENKQNLIEEKTKLEKLKLNNFAASLYEIYNTHYGKFIAKEKLYAIINNAVSSYSCEEGISIEISTKFKIETRIIVELSNLYKNNPDSDESLEALLLLEEMYGKKIKERYVNIPDDIISKAIEETFSEYTGRLPFYSEVSVRIKKLFR